VFTYLQHVYIALREKVGVILKIPEVPEVLGGTVAENKVSDGANYWPVGKRRDRHAFPPFYPLVPVLPH
jgi:hypothetical protein